MAYSKCVIHLSYSKMEHLERRSYLVRREETIFFPNENAPEGVSNNELRDYHCAVLGSIARKLEKPGAELRVRLLRPVLGRATNYTFLNTDIKGKKRVSLNGQYVTYDSGPVRRLLYDIVFEAMGI